MRLVEALFSTGETVTINGSDFPAECVLEDDDGTRVAVLQDLTHLTEEVFRRTYESVKVYAAPLDGQWAIVPISGVQGGHINPSAIRLLDHFPTDADLLIRKVSDFVHLHSHSDASALDGLSTIDEMVAKVVEEGQPGLAITDHGTCANHPKLQSAAKAADIRPIYGIEANYVKDRLNRDKDDLKAYRHLILWAKTDEGLRNLWAMSTESYRTGFYGRARMDPELLRTYHEGVMASTGCLRGPLAEHLLNGDEERARIALSELMVIFGDDLYIELQTNAGEEQAIVNRGLVSLANDYSLPMFVASDSHYPRAEDKDTHAIWLAIQTNKDIQDDTGLFGNPEASYHLMSAEEVAASIDYLPESVVREAMANTVAIAERTQVKFGSAAKPPIFSKGETTRDKDYDRLVKLCIDNWWKVEGRSRPESEYMDRLERELKLLRSKGFEGVYLMVSDYCLDPSTPVLTSDLRWVEVGKLEVGDGLLGFDEEVVVRPGNKKGHRYWHEAEVVDTRRIIQPTFRVTLSDGTATISSADHQWLVSGYGIGNHWVKTNELRIGQQVTRLVSEWDEPNTWEAGYIAGILDGEGSLSLSKVNKNGRSLSLTFSQNEGEVLDTCLRILDAWGFEYTVRPHGARNVKTVRIRGRRAEVLRLLGMARPKRLLSKLDPELLGRVLAMDHPSIVEIEDLGLGEVVAIETTTGTLVAQGMAHHNCRWAKEHGILRGPGRGSGASSLVAYLCNITGVDPIEADLMFERFLTEGRVSLPDFDVDFPASKRQEITDYIVGKYGEENVVRVGTHIRLKNKGVIRDLARVMKSVWDINYADINAISKAIDEAEGDSAGIGKPWDDLWPQIEEEMQQYVAKYPELFSTAERLVGRLKTYGKHAAGLVIAPDANLTQTLPLRTAGKEVVAEFDMESLEALGLVKFDLLTLSTLDKVQMAVDLIKETTGDVIDPDAWVEEYRDPYVWDQICAGHTLGVFQIETPGGTREVKEMQPRSLDELSDVIALVRPGPKKSGLTDTYLRRKRGEEPVTYMDPRLEPILNTTQGAMIYQEQVLRTCMVLAGYNETEADDVRKILGKKKVELVESEGKKFVARAVENGTDREVADTIWMQMAEFSKYAFNRVHSYSYATLAWWTAWLKFTYPAQFLTASLSTVDKDRIPEYINEASRMGYRVLPPDINISGRGFSYKGIEIRYGFDGVKGIGPAVVDALVENQPYESIEDFMERKSSKANMGAVKTLAKVGAFDSLLPRKQAEHYFEWQETLADKCTAWDDPLVCDIEGCTHRREEYNDLPCFYPWDWEPVTIGKSGKPLKPKPVPKKCTKACRNYVPREYEPIEGEYSDKEIQEREMELLGVYLSSTPFDAIEDDVWSELTTGSELEDADEGYYFVPGLITRVRPHTTSAGKAMGFIGVMAYDMEIDVVVFSDTWARHKPDLKPQKLMLFVLRKTDRGYTLEEVTAAT